MSVLSSSLPSTARRGRRGLALGAIVAAVALTACGGDDDATTETATTPATTEASAGATGPADRAALRVTLDPTQTGTPERPAPVKVAVDLRMELADPEVPPTVEAVDIAVPPGVTFRPDGLAACDEERLNDRGPAGCPKASRIGTGTVTARAGTIAVEGQGTALYGGGDRVLLWVEIANPVSVGAALKGRLAEQPDGGYRMALKVPAELQEVAGVPVGLDRLRISLGREDVLATTGCPGDGLPFSARLDVGGEAPIEAQSTATCR